MDLYITLTIIFTASVQSLFGVGVLLFGTPILLLLGHPFLDSLLVLLPVSAAINLFQILKDYKYIEFKIYKKIAFISIPFIIISLFLVSKMQINVTIFIGLFLTLIALKDKILIINICLSKLLYYDKIFYLSMGIIHGVTNLGGALLTAKVFHTNLCKYQKRVTIAISYITFAISQLITIFFLDVKFSISNLLYIFVGLIIYVTVDKFLFIKITEYNYHLLFSIFLFLSGSSLVIKAF